MTGNGDSQPASTPARHNKPWEPWENDYLKNCIQDRTIEDIATGLGRTYDAVRKQASTMGLLHRETATDAKGQDLRELNARVLNIEKKQDIIARNQVEIINLLRQILPRLAPAPRLVEQTSLPSGQGASASSGGAGGDGP